MNTFLLTVLGSAPCLLAVGLSGCATTPTINQIDQSDLTLPVKLLVIESAPHISTKKLKSVLASNGAKAADSKPIVMAGEAHGVARALASMKSALTKDAGFSVASTPPSDSQLVKAISELGFDQPITPDEARRLRDGTEADALLRFRITDYGLTPDAWRKEYIAFEVVSTLAIAGAIAYAGSTTAKAAAGAYLAQETVEESAEAYGGFWALNVVSRPVRVEAKLIQLSPLRTVWEDARTGFSSTRLSRLFRKVSVDEKHLQLDQSTDSATQEVATELSAALSRGSNRIHLSRSCRGTERFAAGC